MFETENMLFLKTLLKYFVILLLFLCAKWDYVGQVGLCRGRGGSNRSTSSSHILENKYYYIW